MQLAKHHEIRHIETASLDDLPAAAESLFADGIELLGINGGDGTVHLTLTALLRAAAGRPLPALALLPGGTTSMSARGVNGGPVSFNRALDALLSGMELPALTDSGVSEAAPSVEGARGWRRAAVGLVSRHGRDRAWH